MECFGGHCEYRQIGCICEEMRGERRCGVTDGTGRGVGAGCGTRALRSGKSGEGRPCERDTLGRPPFPASSLLTTSHSPLTTPLPLTRPYDAALPAEIAFNDVTCDVSHELCAWNCESSVSIRVKSATSVARRRSRRERMSISRFSSDAMRVRADWTCSDAAPPSAGQIAALHALLLELKVRYPHIEIGGHRQLRTGKARTGGPRARCPGEQFPLADIRRWAETTLVAQHEALLEDIIADAYGPGGPRGFHRQPPSR